MKQIELPKRIFLVCSICICFLCTLTISTPLFAGNGGNLNFANQMDCHDPECNVVAYGTYCSSGGSGCSPNECPSGTYE